MINTAESHLKFEEITQGYRVDTGYEHPKGTTVKDVIDYETKELGNDIGLTSDQLGEAAQLSADRVIWITCDYQSAQRYGKPQKLGLPPGSKVIGADGEGGILVLKGVV